MSLFNPMGIFNEEKKGQFIYADESRVSAEVNHRLKQMIEEEVEKNIKSGIYGDFPESWANKINVQVTEGEVSVQTDDPAIMAQEEGVEAHPMTYLEGETIPIEPDASGRDRPVFRKATVESLMQGKFFHPGMEGKGFIQDAIDAAMERGRELINAAHRPDEQAFGMRSQEDDSLKEVGPNVGTPVR